MPNCCATATCMFVVRRIKVDYLRPARLDDSLVVVTESLKIRAAAVLLRQDVQGPLGSCAVLEVELACVPPGGHWPARIPPRWRQALMEMQAARPPA